MAKPLEYTSLDISKAFAAGYSDGYRQALADIREVIPRVELSDEELARLAALKVPTFD